MELLRLGRSDLLVSRIGFGCAAIGGYDYGDVDDDESIAAIHAAVDAGVTLFDTADVYGFGHSETVLAKALGTRRNHVVIATKGGVRWDDAGRTTRDLSKAHLTSAIHESLRRLRVERIPLYQLHWPDHVTPVADALEPVARAQEEGKIVAIGLCNFPMDLVRSAREVVRIDSIQVPYSLLERDWERTLQVCTADLAVSSLCYNPLAQGLFSGKYDRESSFTGTDLRARSALFRGERFDRGLAILERLQSLAARHTRTPAQIALRWLLDQVWVTVALTGIKRASQAHDNAAASGWNLSQDERLQLEEV